MKQRSVRYVGRSMYRVQNEGGGGGGGGRGGGGGGGGQTVRVSHPRRYSAPLILFLCME